MTRFLKCNIESDEGEFLAIHHPNAFILLFFIAKRARRVSGLADGLVIGECHLGDYKSYGLTESKYRTAKKVLCKRSLIKITETCRNRKKLTTGLTTVGTLVQLLDSRVWDINPEVDDDRNDDRLTTGSRPNDEEQEGRRKKKKEKEELPQTPSFSAPEKIRFRENVQLTQAEFDTLLAKHGQDFFKQMLETLDAYKGSTGKTYKSDYHTMKDGGWVVERVKKDRSTAQTKAQNEKTFYSSPASIDGSSPRYQPRNILRGSNAIQGDKVPTNG